MTHWNTHYIRKSTFQTIGGRPESLYYLPELTESEDHKQLVTLDKFEDVSENVVVRDYRNEYTEYFEHVMQVSQMETPNNWRSALDLYRYFLTVM